MRTALILFERISGKLKNVQLKTQKKKFSGVVQKTLMTFIIRYI
jgi:hypothetical protein